MRDIECRVLRLPVGKRSLQPIRLGLVFWQVNVMKRRHQCTVALPATEAHQSGRPLRVEQRGWQNPQPMSKHFQIFAGAMQEFHLRRISQPGLQSREVVQRKRVDKKSVAAPTQLQ